MGVSVARAGSAAARAGKVVNAIDAAENLVQGGAGVAEAVEEGELTWRTGAKIVTGAIGLRHVTRALRPVGALDDAAKAARKSYDEATGQLSILNQPAGCFVAGTLVWVVSSGRSPAHQWGDTGGDESSHGREGATTILTEMQLGIEGVSVGMHVRSTNPRLWERDNSLPDPDSSWLQLRILLRTFEGKTVEIELLRPREWVEERGLVVGGDIAVGLPELAARGTGIVNSIGPAPEIPFGDGSVVTGRFVTHEVRELTEITVGLVGGLDDEGESATAPTARLIGTPIHPMWSIDREDWVPLGELAIGERLQTRDGFVRVTSSRSICDPQPVYNLEIHGQHVYEVTGLGILAHNANALCDAIARGMRALRGPTAPDDLVEVLEKSGRSMDRFEIGGQIHRIKEKMGLGAADDLIFDYSGGVWDSRTGEYIGKFWEPF